MDGQNQNRGMFKKIIRNSKSKIYAEPNLDGWPEVLEKMLKESVS
jgi:hypothetical protein